jgi:hypothetical protein
MAEIEREIKIKRPCEDKGGIVMFCNYLSQQTCQILKERCFRLNQQSKCDSIAKYYPLLVNHLHDPPLAQRVKTDLLGPIIQSFRSYAKNPAPGKKVIAAQPFEKVIRTTLKNQLTPLGVIVTDTGKQYPVSESTPIIADCLAKKGGYPDSIFSMKTWIGGEHLGRLLPMLISQRTGATKGMSEYTWSYFNLFRRVPVAKIG